MDYVIVDCGGFKEIKPIDNPNSIRELQDKFKNATLEGDENGNLKILSGEDVGKLVHGKSFEKKDPTSVLEKNIKAVKRR